MVKWLRQNGVGKIALIGPALLNTGHDPDWAPAAEEVRNLLSSISGRHGAVFVDLMAFMRERVDRGEDPDFTRVPCQQSRSWHASPDDLHFNAYGQRLVAEAFLAGTAAWRPPDSQARRRSVAWGAVRLPLPDPR
jgi:hypothetical protein